VEDADVRVIQASNGFCFTLKALAQFSLISKMSRKNLDGNNSIEAAITGFINFSHSTRTDSAEDFVRP